MDAGKRFDVIRQIAVSATLGSLPSALWKSRGLVVLLDILLKRLPRKQQHTVSTRKRKLPGIPRNNHHGSPNRSFQKKFNRHWRGSQLRPSQRGLAYRAGTLAAFVRATARIHGTGRRLRNL